ncbi:hypothetical protein CIHG_04982 [Coccidioides immitis H538.4]|nr:hypothetical protein CISG_10255 [Coccidioides immitis RMSCC 3703]KMU87042.1 hypothetical protein CIHG_04982 [Coccidioides immitis H538.4]
MEYMPVLIEVSSNFTKLVDWSILRILMGDQAEPVRPGASPGVCLPGKISSKPTLASCVVVRGRVDPPHRQHNPSSHLIELMPPGTVFSSTIAILRGCPLAIFTHRCFISKPHRLRSPWPRKSVVGH